jgi:DNA polymerase V
VNRTYICIDLKSFYASVELAARGHDPLTTNLVVADATRTEKTICLAVSPSLKALGIPGRARLFEVVRRVKEVNASRFAKAKSLNLLQKGEDGSFHFRGSSYDAETLAADPSLELAYLVAPPRMLLYEKISTQIFSIYSSYVSPEDIHVYSIDECFMDVTAYLNTYRLTAEELAIRMIRSVLAATNITATAGIGDNMYLAKIAMDIVAKHVPADEHGVRIARLDEKSYRKTLWSHLPLTDFWRVGRGIAARLAKLGCRTMGDVARLSIIDEDQLYTALGINAELLIDHAWGQEPTEIATIKSYRPESRSLSSAQVLKEPYGWEGGRLIVREMTELLVLELVRKGFVTKQLSLTIDYDKESLEPLRPGRGSAEAAAQAFPGSAPSVGTAGKTRGNMGVIYIVKKTGNIYQGQVTPDRYGRPHPKHSHGTGNLDRWTSSTTAIVDGMMALYDRIIDKDLLIRRVNIAACDLIPEGDIPEAAPVQLDLFTDYEALERAEAKRKAKEDKERRMQKAAMSLQSRFGKNILLKGMNLLEGGTTIERNEMIGGHRAGDDHADGEHYMPEGRGRSEGNGLATGAGKNLAVGDCKNRAAGDCKNRAVGDCKDRAAGDCKNRTAGDCKNRAVGGCKDRAAGDCKDLAVGEDREPENVLSDNGVTFSGIKSPPGFTAAANDPEIVYSDIISLPHWEPLRHPRMSLYDRSAQFSPYKTLSGYEDMVNESARVTDHAPRLEEYELGLLDQKLHLIRESLSRGERPLLTLTVFFPDEKKDGGRYEDITDTVKRIDESRRKIILAGSRSGDTKNLEIDFDRIVKIRI